MRTWLFSFMIIATWASAQSPFTSVRLLFESDQADQGLSILDSCLKKNLHNDSCYYYKALGFMRKENVAQVKTQVYLLERDFPSFYMRHYLQGLLFYYEKDFGKSVEELNKVLARDEKNLKALCNRALILGLLEDFAAAKEDLSKCLGFWPGYVPAYYSRGYWSEVAGQYEEAIIDYEKTIAMDNKYYDAYMGLANVYRLQQKKEKACESISRAIAAGSQIAEELKENFCK